jgi:zinc transport system substrate-binding protein
VIDASASIELIQGPAHEHDPEEKPENHGLHPDPHIWNSLRNARIMVENIYQGLAAVDPGNRIYYRTNEKKYLRQLDSLDRAIERLLAGKTRRSFMVYHPAWTYLALDYNLTQIPVAALGKEPTARGIEALIEQARRSQTRVVFASPQFSTKSAEVIAREIDGRVIMIDPLARDYLENMKRIAQTLAQTME